MKSLTTLSNLFTTLSLNTTSQNIAYGKQRINDNHRYLMQKYFFNESSYTIQTVGDQQGYLLPFNYSKLKTGTITNGNLRWNPTEILTRREWDDINVFPYYSSIPNNFFIYGQDGVQYLNFWPIPSTGSTQITYTTLTGTFNAGDIIIQGLAEGKILTVSPTDLQVAVSSQVGFTTGSFTDTTSGATAVATNIAVTPGEIITFNYKIRVPDLSLSDYVTGTVSMNSDTTTSLTVTGSGTSWLSAFSPTAGSVIGLNLWIQFPSPLGDGNWYQISSVDSDTQITLLQPYQGADATGATYVIGQIPLILEDFHDLLVYNALTVYYSSVNKDMDKVAEFRGLYEAGIKMMDEYVGSKSLNVNLARTGQIRNPNLYFQGR